MQRHKVTLRSKIDEMKGNTSFKAHGIGTAYLIRFSVLKKVLRLGRTC